MRIAKYIARCGYCSRRQAEQLITEGLVRIKDKVIRDFATLINDSDQVYVKNKLLSVKPTEVWLFNKASGLIVSRQDEKNRKVIFDVLPEYLQNFKAVGRLDYNSEGLLLLTNNGELSKSLEMPDNQIKRRYQVRAFGRVNFDIMQTKLKQGICIDGVNYRSIDIKAERKCGNNTWFTLTLNEGKNREIRNIFSHFNLLIDKLIRIEYGMFKLNNLPIGAVCKAPQQLVDFYLQKLCLS